MKDSDSRAMIKTILAIQISMGASYRNLNLKTPVMIESSTYVIRVFNSSCVMKQGRTEFQISFSSLSYEVLGLICDAVMEINNERILNNIQ